MFTIKQCTVSDDGDDKDGRLFAYILNHCYAFRHIFKNGGTTVEWQTGVGTHGHVPRWGIGNRKLMAVVRDPIDHFLSGWAECGLRESLGSPQLSSFSNSTYDGRIQSWLSTIQSNPHIKAIKNCRVHSYPQANFLLEGNSTLTSLDLIGDLRELPEVLQLAGFQYNYNISKTKGDGNVASGSEVKRNIYPKRLDLLSEETLKKLCSYLMALDYYLFDFEPPKVCHDDSFVLPLLGSLPNSRYPSTMQY